MHPDLDALRVPPGGADLASRPTAPPAGWDGAKDVLRGLRRDLRDLQARLYAEHERAVLVVFQAMDAGGKDGAIRSVFSKCSQSGIRVSRFQAPCHHELDQDFLWRHHVRTPRRGHIGVWNRSHYGGVVVERVKGLVPEAVWRRRYEHVRAFEGMLHDEGTRVVKVFLNISKDEQRARLQRRLDRPDKQWKFSQDDVEQRHLWDAYRQAYADALSETSTKDAPWWVVPADDKRYRDIVVATVLRDVLEDMAPRLPEPGTLPTTIM